MSVQGDQAAKVLSGFSSGAYGRDENLNAKQFLDDARGVTGDSRLYARQDDRTLVPMAIEALQFLITAQKSQRPISVPKEKVKFEIEKYKEGPTEKKGDVLGDYYKRLGVDRNASDEEINKAYKNYMRDNHPDAVKARGGTEEDVRAAGERSSSMGEAYYYLSKPDRREEYNQIWDRRFAGEGTKPPEVQAPQLPSPESNDQPADENAPYIDISFQPRGGTPNSIKQAESITGEFQHDVLAAGKFPLNKMSSGEMKFLSLYEDRYTDSQVSAALKLYSKGVNSEEFAQTVISKTALTQAEREELLNIAYFHEALAASGVESLPTSGILATAAANPAPKIALAYAARKPVGDIVFRRGAARKVDQGLQAKMFLKKAGARRQKMIDSTVKGIKAGTRKLAQAGGSKVAAQAGAKIAAKTGLKAVIAGVLQALGISVGGPVGSLIAAALSFVIVELIPLVFKVLKKVFDPETLIKLLLILGAGLMMLGMTVPGMLVGLSSLGFNKAAGGMFRKTFSNVSKKASQAASTTFLKITAVVIAALSLPIALALASSILVLILIVVLMNTAAYVVPPHLTSAGPGAVQNPYIGVTKTVKSVDSTKCNSPKNTPSYLECLNSNLNFDVEYTITITAKIGVLSNVQISEKCTVEKENQPTKDCLAPSPAIPTSTPDGTISPALPYTFTYRRSFTTPTHTDSLATDVVTVTADAVDAAGQKSGGSASICIGTCPQNCPSGWPTNNGHISQGAYSTKSNYSHHTMEALDIAAVAGSPVFSTHAGIVETHPYDSCLNNYVHIISNCGGKEFYSQYAHMESVAAGVTNGAFIAKGQMLGISNGDDSQSTCSTGPHLHYRFKYTDGSNPSYASSPPFMWQPYIPANIPRGCNEANECRCYDINNLANCGT